MAIDRLRAARRELAVCEAYLSPGEHGGKPTREQWAARKAILEAEIERLTRPVLTLVKEK